MKRRQVYLVPGFLGFSNIGGLNYFQGVREVLGEALATSRSGQVGILGTAQLVGLTQGARDLIGCDHTRFLDTASKKFVSLTTESGEDMWAYFREIASDQGAMVQLMPEAMHLFNAAVTDHQTIRYSSLVAISPPPLTGYNATDLLSPVRAALAAVFILLHNTTASEHRHYPYPNPAEEVLASYLAALPYSLDSRSNDGIVPTLSQVYGRVLDIVVAVRFALRQGTLRENLGRGS